VSPLLAPLTRPELDALLADSEHAFTKAHIALAACPLDPETVQGFAGVAQDCLSMWQLALDESIQRLWHGEG
jgi:hypothetical protein